MKKHVTLRLPTFSLALVLTTSAALAQINYVDATYGAGNTLEFTNGSYQTWTPLTGGNQGASGDGVWAERGFGNSATIYQNAGFGATDNANRLVTSVSGLPLDTYEVYAYFWNDVSGWRMQASLTDNVGGDLPLFTAFSPGVVQWYTGADATILSSDPSVNGGVNPFNTSVVVAEGNRRLLQITLGQVTGTSFDVFIDDDPNMLDSNERTWYDGVGFAAVPEPSSLALGGLGLLALWWRGRR